MRPTIALVILWLCLGVLGACSGGASSPPFMEPAPASGNLLPCEEEGGTCVGEPQSSTCAHPLQLSCGANNGGISCCLE